MKLKNNKDAFAMVMLFVAAVIIVIIFFLMTRTKKQDASKTNTSIIKEAGIDTSSYKNILDSTKEVIKGAEATRADLP